MTPRTRSGGAPNPEKVYTSSTTPKLQQSRFPTRRTTVRGYGRKHPRRKVADVPDDEHEEETKSSPRQKTLTQMQWVDAPPTSLRGEDEERERPTRSRKRRKTDGDLPSSPPPARAYKTQTLTQMGSFNSRDDPLPLDDGPSDEDVQTGRLNDGEVVVKGKGKAAATPQTPSARRVRLEIPSSQESPITPMLARYSPVNTTRSPLKDKSTNVMSPLQRFTDMAKLPRKLVVEDSYATATTKSPSSSVENHSPAKSHTQHKSVRFVTPSAPGASQASGKRAPLTDITEDMAEDTEDSGMPSSPSPLRPRGAVPDREIADSDEDFEVWDDDDADTQDEQDAYGEVGEETQRLVDEMVSSTEKQASAELTPMPLLAHSDTSNDNLPSSAAIIANATSSSFSEVPTVRLSSPPQRLPPASTPTLPLETQSQDEPSLPWTQAKSQYATQGLESQRIPLEAIRAMGPQTDRSDVFISVHPQPVEKIVAGTKNHEFRNYRIPKIVTRMWIYTTAPASELRYMARISHAKQPGQIEDETGEGNKEFNEGKMMAKFAYELLGVYELNNPVPLREMKEHGWVEGAPQKYTYVPPAVVGHLMANLRCSVFGPDEEEGQEEAGDSLDKMLGRPSSPIPVTVSQEVTNQLLSEATQHTSDPVYVVPSSQEFEREQPRPGANQAGGPTKKPSPAAATTYKRPMNPTPNRASVRPSQATTVSQTSSPSTSPVKAMQRVEQSSSTQLPSLEDEESFIPPASSSLHIRSSQLLSKSQMLPESLRSADLSEIGDDVDIVYDSEADMDEV